MEVVKINLEKPDRSTIELAIQVFENGGIVIYPTDTCYGIGCHLEDQEAIDKISKIKNRVESANKKYSAIVKDVNQASSFLKIDHLQLTILQNFLPGPFTFILDYRNQDGNLGIRIPNYQITQLIADQLAAPYITTSANLSGQINPYSWPDLEAGILSIEKNRGLVDLVLDAGPLPNNNPSTVVDLTQKPFRILRQGPGTLTSVENNL